MQLIGTIVRLQAQVVSLKVGSHGERRYDPEGLRAVPALLLTADGVIGMDEHGAIVHDVHNARHAETKNRGGKNGISFGFTSHYERMRDRFGSRLDDGIAGENLLVESDHGHTEFDLKNGVAIETVDGGRALLTDVIVAEPCLEFSRWALGRDDLAVDQSVTAALEFLRHGTRGYYARYAGPDALVHPGARVFRL